MWLSPDMWRTAFSSIEPPHARPVTVPSRGAATVCVTLERGKGAFRHHFGVFERVRLSFLL